MTDDHEPTINELLDELHDGREQTSRRVYAARQEIREAVDALCELLEEYPDEPGDWTVLPQPSGSLVLVPRRARGLDARRPGRRASGDATARELSDRATGGDGYCPGRPPGNPSGRPKDIAAPAIPLVT